MTDYSLVTVVFEEDVGALRLQARSLARYCPPDLFSGVTVIDNSARPMSPRKRGALAMEYGPLSATVRFVQRDDLCAMAGASGWWSQQVLKIAVANLIETRRYLVLDAKHHLVWPLRRSFLEAADGRVRVAAHGYAHHPLRRYLERALTYVGLPIEPHVARFAATSPPFVFDTSAALDLMRYARDREGAAYETAVVKHLLTEFFFYSAFLKKREVFDQVYCDDQIECPVIWRGRAAASACAEAIDASRSTQAPFFGVQREATLLLDARAQALVAEYWRERALFGDRQESAAFLRRLRRSALKHLIKTLPRRVVRQALMRLGKEPT